MTLREKQSERNPASLSSLVDLSLTESRVIASLLRMLVAIIWKVIIGNHNSAKPFGLGFGIFMNF